MDITLSEVQLHAHNALLEVNVLLNQVLQPNAAQDIMHFLDQSHVLSALLAINALQKQ